jgi:hypothetical protein
MALSALAMVVAVYVHAGKIWVCSSSMSATRRLLSCTIVAMSLQVRARARRSRRGVAAMMLVRISDGSEVRRDVARDACAGFRLSRSSLMVCTVSPLHRQLVS